MIKFIYNSLQISSSSQPTPIYSHSHSHHKAPFFEEENLRHVIRTDKSNIVVENLKGCKWQLTRRKQILSFSLFMSSCSSFSNYSCVTCCALVFPHASYFPKWNWFFWERFERGIEKKLERKWWRNNWRYYGKVKLFWDWKVAFSEKNS